MLRLAFDVLVVAGGVLLVWAGAVNPAGTGRPPEPLGKDVPRIVTGPYRICRHPMYVGTWMFVTGCAGLAAGPWNAVAIGTLSELLLREWAMREKGE